MEIKHLRTFLGVAKHLNFTRAGQALHLAQSSVSAQIAALEQELGVKLFDRLGRRVLLTQAGQRLEEYARRMVEMTDEIRGQMAAGTDPGGSLTVRVPETLAREHMPQVAARFLARFPEARLNLINCEDRMLQEELAAGSIDLAFLLSESPVGQDMDVTMLASVPLVLVAAPGHELAGRERTSPRELDGRRLLLLRTDCSYRKDFEALLARHGVRPSIQYFASMTAARRLLARGIGVTLLPEITARKDLAAGRLIELPWALGPMETALHMIRHQGKWRSPLLAAFMDMCRDVMAAQDM